MKNELLTTTDIERMALAKKWAEEDNEKTRKLVEKQTLAIAEANKNGDKTIYKKEFNY